MSSTFDHHFFSGGLAHQCALCACYRVGQASPLCVYIEAFHPDAELLKPARTLITPHLMGRPLGLPHQVERQREVILAALRLLETADHAPTIEAFVA